jgi:threonine/homoserine/homoserine lactone efflux protein
LLKYILIGGSFGFASAAQPGPLQAFLLSRIATGGWRRTLPACLAPLISDGPIAVLVLVVLSRVPGGFERFLRAAGGFLLLYFAYRAIMEWRSGMSDEAREPPSAPRTLLQAVGVNLLNPGPYLGWGLVLGPLAIEAWAQSPVHAVTFVGAFYAVIVLSLAAFILLLGTTSFLGSRGRRVLLLVSALALAILGVYQLGGSLMPA